MKIERVRRRYFGAGLGLHWVHERDGGPVLKTESSWRTIRGVWLNTRRGSYWLVFGR